MRVVCRVPQAVMGKFQIEYRVQKIYKQLSEPVTSLSDVFDLFILPVLQVLGPP